MLLLWKAHVSFWKFFLSIYRTFFSYTGYSFFSQVNALQIIFPVYGFCIDYFW